MVERSALVAEKRYFKIDKKSGSSKGDDLLSVRHLKRKYNKMNFNSYLFAFMFSFLSVAIIFITENIGIIFFICLVILTSLLILYDTRKQKVLDELDLVIKAIK